MVKLRTIGEYDQDLEDLLVKDPNLETEVYQRITWFKKNPNDTRLDNHPLTKRMEGSWAFSITDDIRIVYKWSNKATVRFLAIGPHEKVYPKK